MTTYEYVQYLLLAKKEAETKAHDIPKKKR